MAGSCTYSVLLPDYGDLDNETKNCPGYRVYVLERDGGISLQMQHADKDPSTDDGLNAVFMNIEEAKNLIEGIQEAIDKTSYKNANHPNRGIPC